MKLTVDDIRNITFGALRVTETDEGLTLRRHTEKQSAFWHGRREDLGRNADGAAGIRLDFYTDSKHLTLHTGHMGKHELYVDGIVRSRFMVEEFVKEGKLPTFHLTDPLGHEKDEVRVTLCFPAHSPVNNFETIELDDGAYFRPYTYSRKMLFIGDSITQGWNSRYDSMSYAHRVARFFDANYVNQGIGGAYFHPDGFDRIDFDPDIVTVAYGTNDFGFYPTYDEMRKNVRAHLELIHAEYGRKKLFVLTPIWRNKREGKRMGNFETACAIVREEAEALGITVIDGLYLVPPIPEFFADEYLHPNDEGFSIYAENLCAEILKHL